MMTIRANEPISTPSAGTNFPLTPLVASIMAHLMIGAGALQIGMSGFSPPQPEAIIVDLIIQNSGAGSDNQTRSEPKAIAVPQMKKAIARPLVRQAVKPSRPKKETLLAPRTSVTEMPGEDIESGIPAILTASTAIVEPAPSTPEPAGKAALPRNSPQPKPAGEKPKQSPVTKKALPDTRKKPAKTKSAKKHKITNTKKKKPTNSRASPPGRGKKQKGRARKIQTQGVRYSGAGLSNPRPRYPPSARRKRFQGRVLLAVVVTTSGRAGSVRIRKSSGYQLLDQAALKTVKRWRFQPATRNGKAVRARVIVPITFKLKG